MQIIFKNGQNNLNDDVKLIWLSVAFNQIYFLHRQSTYSLNCAPTRSDTYSSSAFLNLRIIRAEILQVLNISDTSNRHALLCCLTYLDLLDLPLISMKCPFKKQQRTSMQGAPAVKGLKGLRIEYPMKTAALLLLTLISNQYSTEIAGRH